MRLVLDTNIVIAALRSQGGASAELIRMAVRGRIRLLGTLNLALEYLDVCGRPAVWADLGISSADAIRFGEEVAGLLNPVEVKFRWRPVSRDPGDDHVVEAALNGGANAIVTFNGRDFAEASKRFNLLVCNPGDILALLEQSDG